MASNKEQEAIAIKVPSKDDVNDTSDSKNDDSGEKKVDKPTKKDPDELSEEDKALQEALNLSVERTTDPEAGVVALALARLRRTDVREA